MSRIRNHCHSEGELSVCIIDVGQAENILITLGTAEIMLIDAGEKSGVDEVFSELDERGITTIDILVATHPHADHIGGMAAIIERYEIGAIYMPDKTATIKTHLTLMQTIDAYSIPIIEAYAGFLLSLAAQCAKSFRHTNIQTTIKTTKVLSFPLIIMIQSFCLPAIWRKRPKKLC